MKNLKILFSVLLLSVFALSCSSDSASGTKVKYQIGNIDSSITQIKYTDKNGNTVTLTSSSAFAGSGDSKTITVSDNNLPFTANLEITSNNTTSTVKHFILAIYVNDTPGDATYFDAPPNAVSTNSVDFIAQP